MLNVRDANEEFEMKTQCLRRKSLDFQREREKARNGSAGKAAAIQNLNKLDNYYNHFQESKPLI